MHPTKTKLYCLLILIGLTNLACNTTKVHEKTITTNSTATQEALLIGTFHYHNPGADVAKTKSFDVMSPASQQVLETMTEQIKAYHPTKIFVEWPVDEQAELDSLYEVYLKGDYFKNKELSNFYLKNEIFQLAFRAAKKNNLERVYAIDYTKTSFPFEEVMQAITTAKQTELEQEIMDGIATFTTGFDNKIEAGASLLELTYYLNTPEMRYFSNDFHNNIMLQVGELNDYSGPFLTAEWFKRNLYMWSFIQKHCQPTDERIMVLAGASHIAMFENFIKENKNWSAKELKDIME